MAKKYCPNHPDKRLWSKGVCIDCYRTLYAKPLKRTKLNPLSQKQKNILVTYRLLRKKYLEEHPICEINLRGCEIKATEIHHTAKKYSEELWLNTKLYKASCRHCHRKVENSPDLARSLDIYNYTASLKSEIY